MESGLQSPAADKPRPLLQNSLFLTPIPILPDIMMPLIVCLYVHTDYRTFVKKVSTHKILIKEMGSNCFWGQRVKPF